MNIAKNGIIFAIYAIQTSQVVQEPTKLPTKYEQLKKCLKRVTLIHFFIMNLMIVTSNFKKVRFKNEFLDCNINLIKISQKTSFHKLLYYW